MSGQTPGGFPYRQHPHELCGSNTERQEVGDPGHCEDCCSVGHVVAHPELGCGDVGCYRAHGEPGSDPSTEDVCPTPEKHVELAEEYITAAEGPDGPACDFGRYRRLAELHLRAAEVKHALREWRKTWRIESPEIGPELKPVGKISIAPRGGVVGGVRLPEHATAIVYGDPQTVELACHKPGVHWAEASTATYEGFRFGDGRVISWAAEHAHAHEDEHEDEHEAGEDAETDGLPRCTVSAWTLDGERRCLLDAGHASKHVADVDGRPVRW